MRFHRLSCLPVVLLLVALAPGALAQDAMPVQVEVSHAAFAYGQEESMVELYLAVNAASLDYVSEDDIFSARLPLDVALVRSATTDLPAADDDAVWSDSVLLRFALQDTTGIAEGQHFIHQIRTVVPPGEYELRMSIPPGGSGVRPELELRRDVHVPDFASGDEPALSDITLATSINQSNNREGRFYKNELDIRPNANQLFGEGLSNLFYYAEAYGTDEVAGADGEYTLFAYVSEANRPQPLQQLQKRTSRTAREPDVLVGHFNLASLPSGSYFLRLALLNENNESVVEQSQKFFVYNPGVQRQQATGIEMEFETSPYATMSEEEVDKGIEHALLIANENERRRFGQVDALDERRRALMNFWQGRDPRPDTPVNEFRDEFYERLQYANDRYSSNTQEGWMTDRGRIVIKYGLPTSIEPHLYDRGMRPHEIWNYNALPGEGRASFIFADLGGFGRFELIHSTVPGERSLPNWQDELRNE